MNHILILHTLQRSEIFVQNAELEISTKNYKDKKLLLRRNISYPIVFKYCSICKIIPCIRWHLGKNGLRSNKIAEISLEIYSLFNDRCRWLTKAYRLFKRILWFGSTRWQRKATKTNIIICIYVVFPKKETEINNNFSYLFKNVLFIAPERGTWVDIIWKILLNKLYYVLSTWQIKLR